MGLQSLLESCEWVRLESWLSIEIFNRFYKRQKTNLKTATYTKVEIALRMVPLKFRIEMDPCFYNP